jgi:ADP-ribosylglycohydrolase/DNA-binding transcriptional regulator YhcF (GntR family)
VKPVTKRTLASLVAEQIKSDIVQGRLQASHKLPSEGELCATLDVGRPTLREALRILEGQGWIQIRFSAGAYVSDPGKVADRMAAHHNRESLLDFAGLELQQLREEGRDVGDAVIDRLQRLKADGTARQVEEFFEELAELPMAPGFGFVEPDDLGDIEAERPAGAGIRPRPVDEGEARTRIRGGFLGRCIGNLMGSPLQGWSPEAIEKYLLATGTYPLNGYVPYAAAEAARGEYTIYMGTDESPRNGTRVLHRDEEAGEALLGHTVLGLRTLRRCGPDFSTEDVGVDWLSALPYEQALTAERQAYGNLVRGLTPPATARSLNPFREWIGALVRADVYGYVCPGDPARAAALAWRDARLSHTKNGIYGSLFVAAAIAAAFTEDSAEGVVETGLACLPRRSRMAVLVGGLLAAKRGGADWKTALRDALAPYRDYRRPHALPSTARLVVGLLYGRLAFRETVCQTVMAGGDTDCTGAAAGSIAGIRVGVDGLPADLREPVGDRVLTPVLGYNDVSIRTVVDRVCEMAFHVK